MGSQRSRVLGILVILWEMAQLGKKMNIGDEGSGVLLIWLKNSCSRLT